MRHNKTPRPAYISYVIGFVLSLALTLTAYSFVTGNILSGWTLTYVLLGLALAQMLIQLLFFLHL